MGRPTKPRPLEPEEVIPVLRRERNEQRFRIAELNDALTEQDYGRVAELVDSLSEGLAQFATDGKGRPLLFAAHGTYRTRKPVEALQQTRSRHA